MRAEQFGLGGYTFGELESDDNPVDEIDLFPGSEYVGGVPSRIFKNPGLGFGLRHDQTVGGILFDYTVRRDYILIHALNTWFSANTVPTDDGSGLRVSFAIRTRRMDGTYDDLRAAELFNAAMTFFGHHGKVPIRYLDAEWARNGSDNRVQFEAARAALGPTPTQEQELAAANSATWTGHMANAYGMYAQSVTYAEDKDKYKVVFALGAPNYQLPAGSVESSGE